jgi:transposase
MYIRKSTRTYKGKTYTNYLLVESVQTPKGPRQRTICSLGSLKPAPKEHWLSLAHRLQSALEGQLSLDSQAIDPLLLERLKRRQTRRTRKPRGGGSGESSSVMEIDAERVQVEQAREAGPVHVGHQLWRQLGLEEILSRAGLSNRACMLTEAMVLNRLIDPLSEHAMPKWMRRTALGEILGVECSELDENALYRNLDRLYPNRERIERELAEREKTLFNLEDTVYLYDLTSTYFEGAGRKNSQARRGYSRDRRPDCKQVVVGLVLDRDGFPKAHEVFDGNVQDRATVGQMLEELEKRTGRKGGATVVVDRGMAYEENLKEIRHRGHHYIVAGAQQERNQWLEEFESEQGWEEVLRTASPRNRFQKKSRLEVKRRQSGEEVYILCRSEGRQQKDRAIREAQEQKLLGDLLRLKQRIEKGQLKKSEKIHQAIGRLKERYGRVARYYRIEYDAEQKVLWWREEAEKKALAEKLDGSYVLKTDRQDLTAEEIWRTYILLTRVEQALAKGEGHLNGVQRVTSERSLTVERLLHRGRLRGIGTSVANHLRVAEDRGEQIP